MKTTLDLIKLRAQISAGNFVVSVGVFTTGDIAIVSKSTGDFVSLSSTKRSKKLKSIKRKFKHFMCSEDQFFFSHFSDDMTVDLINMLKK